MTCVTRQPRLAWEDRWSQPELTQLLEPIKEPYRQPFEQLIERIDDYAEVERSLDWCGDAWKWTIHYVLHDGSGGQGQTLCYLVPRHDSPVICIPLTDQLIQKLPMKRLGKVVRDGIKSAKCAVSTYWATWSPGNRTEVDQLLDLIKRKHKLALAGKPEDN